METMKLSDFILLNVEQKTSTLMHEGILVGKRSAGGQLVFLFRLEGFYVESYCNLKEKSIEEFRILISMNPLSPYLDAISLEDLFN
jgi:hypothetical protein